MSLTSMACFDLDVTGLLALDSCGRDLQHAAAAIHYNAVACACF